MIGRFFKLPRIRQYNYQPRYWDERKEELDKRVDQIKKEMGVTDDNPNGERYFKGDYNSHIKGQMRGYFTKTRKKEARSSNVRLLIILFTLFALTYYIIFF